MFGMNASGWRSYEREQHLLNLAGDSGGELTVESQLQDGQLQFSVSDTGVGLPKEKMDQIFSAFFTTEPQGSGMGLSISRSIVESHGGRLWATANDGRGATFHFTLPTTVHVVQEPNGTYSLPLAPTRDTLERQPIAKRYLPPCWPSPKHVAKVVLDRAQPSMR